MNVKSLKSQLFAAVVMMLVACVALGSSTYAWFAMNDKVTATDLQVTVKSNDTFLLIGTSEQDAAAIQNDKTTTIQQDVEDSDAAVYPSKPWDHTSDASIYTNAASTLGVGNTVADKSTAGAPGNWITANSNDPSKVGTAAADILSGSDKALDSFTNYVIKRSVNLTLAVGSVKSHHLTVQANMTNPADAQYTATTDTTFQESKIYYTKNAGTGVYSKATVTAGETVSGTYYELTGGTSMDAVRVLVVTDNNEVAILKSGDSVTNLYGTTDLDITDHNVHNVDIYIYYDGSDNSVYTNNAASLGGANIILTFGVTPNP